MLYTNECLVCGKPNYGHSSKLCNRCRARNKKGGVMMKDYQERVLEEQEELSKKINALTIFITNKDNLVKISNMEYETLYEQLNIMLKYNFILLTRINYFKGDS